MASLDSFPTRITGIIRRPRATFIALKTTPRWADILALTFLVTTALSAGLLATSVGKLALLDQWERTAVAFGQKLSEEQYGDLRDASKHGAVYAAVTSFGSGPALTVALAALLFGGFRLAGTSSVAYRQVLSVVAYSGVILMLRQIVATPTAYAREMLAAPVTLKSFFGVIDETSPIARFLSSIDLFVVWWIVVIAIGMSVLDNRSARRLTMVFLGVYTLLAAALALAMAAAARTS